MSAVRNPHSKIPDSGRSIVITGCSSGLGRATALHLARRGWRVFATVRKEADQASLLVEAVAAGLQERLTPLLNDITREDHVRRLGRTVAEAGPRLDALLNNAGTAYAGPLELLALDDLRAQFEINVLAHLAVTQAMLPLLKAARGTIVNVSSVSGRITSPLMGPYSASKFALEALSDALRIELAPFGVRVVVVEPGASPTGIWMTSLKRALDGLAERQVDVSAYARLVKLAEVRARRRSHSGFPPKAFAGLVERILENPRPRARYALPARTAWAIRLRRLVPDEWWDELVRQAARW